MISNSMVQNLLSLGRIRFFMGKFYRDLTNPLRYVYNVEGVHTSQLGKYYLVFDEMELMRGGSQNFHFDERGIPIIPSYIDVQSRKMHYFPIAIGQYALAIYHTWLVSSRVEDQRRFLRLANWFVEHQAADGYWNASVELPIYGLVPPWPSAMAQGRGLSVLTRAWQCTSDDKYIESAQRGLVGFLRPIREGGLVDEYDGWLTYEEYPSQPAPHVLNGMIFALFGLWDLCRVHPENAKALQLFEQGAASVEALLPRYDTTWWSLYDLYHLEASTPINPATAHYHDIHINQLKVMHAITGREQFALFARRWADYQDGWTGRTRAYAAKAIFIARRKLF